MAHLNAKSFTYDKHPSCHYQSTVGFSLFSFLKQVLNGEKIQQKLSHKTIFQMN